MANSVELPPLSSVKNCLHCYGWKRSLKGMAVDTFVKPQAALRNNNAEQNEQRNN